MIDRSVAEQLDADDPLGRWRDEFVIPDPDLIYLDGNSLGRTPRRTVTAVRRVVEEQWAGDLIASWWDHGWLDLTLAVGDELAPLHRRAARRGRRPRVDHRRASSSCSTSPSTSSPAPRVIAVDDRDFPTDRYVAEGVARLRGGELRHGIVDLDGVDVVIRSIVDYRTAEIADVAAETARAAAAGATTIWDLSHAAGVLDVDLHALGVEFAVGCTYKFLNGGPGRAGVRVRGEPPARPDRAADLGMVRPIRPVRHGASVRGADRDRPDAQRHAPGARPDGGPGGDPPDRRGRYRSDRRQGPGAHRLSHSTSPTVTVSPPTRRATRRGAADTSPSAIPTRGGCMPASSNGRSSSTTATPTCCASDCRR